MSKIINEQQIGAIMALLEKYNVGVMEHAGAREMFNKLPDCPCESEKVEEKVEEGIDKKD